MKNIIDFLKKHITKEIILSGIFFSIYPLLFSLFMSPFITSTSIKWVFALMNGVILFFTLKYIFKFKFEKSGRCIFGATLVCISYVSNTLLALPGLYISTWIISSEQIGIIEAIIRATCLVCGIGLILNKKAKRLVLITSIIALGFVVLIFNPRIFGFGYSVTVLFLLGFVQNIGTLFLLKFVIESSTDRVAVNESVDEVKEDTVAKFFIKLIKTIIVIGIFAFIASTFALVVYAPRLVAVVLLFIFLYLWTVFKKLTKEIHLFLFILEQVILLPAVIIHITDLFRGIADGGVEWILYSGLLILPSSILRLLHIYTLSNGRNKKASLMFVVVTIVFYSSILVFSFQKAKVSLESSQTYFYPCGFSLTHNELVYNLSDPIIIADDYDSLKPEQQDNRFLNKEDLDKFVFGYQSSDRSVDPREECKTSLGTQSANRIKEIDFPSSLEVTLFRQVTLSLSLKDWAREYITENHLYVHEIDLKEVPVGVDGYNAIVTLGGWHIFFSELDELGQKVLGHIDCRSQYLEIEDSDKAEKQCIDSLKSFKLTKPAQFQE